MRLSRTAPMIAAVALLAAVAGLAPAAATAITPPQVLTALTASTIAPIVSSDGASGDEFGSSVAINASDTIVAGAPQAGAEEYQGVAYVFITPPGAQRWSQQATLTASDGAAYDEFGTSVAIDGDTIVVGAPQHHVGSDAHQGAAYVFTYSGGEWTQAATLTASDGAADDEFGTSVAIDGDTIIVGAPQHQVGPNTDQGAAYVFSGSGGSWTQQAELIASTGAAGDWFGASVAVSGDTVLVGATQPSSGAGAAYTYSYSGTGWGSEYKLVATDGGAEGDDFGCSVALSGSEALIGAKQHQVGLNTQQGAAYLFQQSSGSWDSGHELTASNGASSDCFGSSVALTGDVAIVGAINAGTDGGAYVFTHSGSDPLHPWLQQDELTAADASSLAQFGNAVALSGDDSVVGAQQASVTYAGGATHDYQGDAYVFSMHVPTTVSVALSKSSVPYESAYCTVTATVKYDDAPQLDRQVVFQTSADDSHWSNLAAVPTAANGQARVVYSLPPSSSPRTCYVRALAVAAPYYAEVPCAGVKLSVTPYLTTPSTPSSVKRGRSFTIYGYLKPRHTSGASNVSIKLYRSVHGRWSLYKTVKAKNSTYNSLTTKYSVSTSVPSAGSWRAYAYYAATSSYAAYTSGYRTFSAK